MMKKELIKPLKVPNTGMIAFRNITNTAAAEDQGHLTPITGREDIPFDIRRIYYIYGVDHDLRRGFHSHRDLEQVLIALGGTVKVLVKTPVCEQVVTLEKPWEGLYIGPYVWREMFDFSENATLLVLASEPYTESDYLRDYDAYEQEAIEFFSDK